MGLLTRLRAGLGRLRGDEAGSYTIFGIYLTAATAIVGGIAIDYQNLLLARTQLQVAADAVAHAAIFNRTTKTAEESKTAALALAQQILPCQAFGDVLRAEDIVLGTWDATNRAFTVDPTSSSAVLVSTARLQQGGNPVRSHLMQMVGLPAFDVRTQAVYLSETPNCLREGFIARGVVDIQSNNTYKDGFCIHSETRVELNSSNSFELGTTVSMPSLANLRMPNSGFATNTGLQQALRETTYDLSFLDRLDQDISAIMTYGSTRMPAYVTTPVVTYVHGKNINVSQLRQNAYNVVTCNGKDVTFRADMPMRNMVFYTTCEVTLSNGTVMENTTLIGAATDASQAIKGSHVQVGANDSCAASGGATIITRGGMRFASGLQAFGAQLIARHDIQFAANANGIQGASFFAGGRIDGTSNMTFGFCGTGMEQWIELRRYRLAG